ncbi:MAG: DinB/UmuC family translesion DNA polymerase, partial [Polaribacter sp.]
LRASAGISINKFIAKIASDINKPNGQKTVYPEEVIQFLEELPVNKFYGVGKVTAAKMYNLGIFVGNDLKKKTVEELIQLFGKSGTHYYNIVRGIHNSAVKPNRIRKSIAAERTFNENISSEIFMLERLDKIADALEKRMKKSNAKGKTITLKIKYSDFTQQTRSKTKMIFMQSKNDFFPVVKELLYQEKLQNSVRLLGLSFGNLNTEKKEPVWVQLRFNF